MKKTLTKSSTDKKLAGVCGGIAEYSDIDVTIIRVLWCIATFMFGTGLLLYIILALVVPTEEQREIDRKAELEKEKKEQTKEEQL